MQIIGSVIASFSSVFLLRNWAFNGGIVAVILFYFSYIVPAIYFASRVKIKRVIKGLSWHREYAVKLLKYSVMALSSVISIPLIEILIRNALANKVGDEAVGIWLASQKISSAYMGFFIVFLSVYYYPIISKIKNKEKLASIVNTFTLFIMGVFLVFAAAFYLAKAYVISAMLTSDFNGVNEYLMIQLIGDFLRISSYVVGFVVLAKAATFLYIFCELMQGVLFYLSTTILLNNGFGLSSAFYGALSMNLIYFICLTVGFKCFYLSGK
jgi:PST family polysaccharide transporter/antigen flippase